jgi:hypothetical protein
MAKAQVLGRVGDDDLERARQHYAEARARRREIEDRLDAARTALETIHIVDRDTLVPAVRDRVAPFADMSPTRLRSLVAQLEDQLDRALFAQRAAREEFEAARAVEIRRRTAELQPAHREAVHRIAEIVEVLSEAIEVERAIRAEIEAIGGLGTLPDGSSPLGPLTDPKSPLADWNRRVLVAGLLR